MTRLVTICLACLFILPVLPVHAQDQRNPGGGAPADDGPVLRLYWAGFSRMSTQAAETSFGRMLSGSLGQALAPPIANGLLMLGTLEGRNPVRVVPVTRALLQSPICLTVDRFSVPKVGGREPTLNEVLDASLVVSAPAGSDIRKALDDLVAQVRTQVPLESIREQGAVSVISLPENNQLMWGFSDKLFVLGTDARSVEATLQGRRVVDPHRLGAQMVKSLKLPRAPLAALDVNVAAIRRSVQAIAGDQATMRPTAMFKLETLDRFTAAISPDQTGFRMVQRTVVAGELLEAPALDAAFMKHLPADIVMGQAGSVFPANLFDMFMGMLLQSGQVAPEQVEVGLDQVNQVLGFKVRDDLLANLGPRYALYMRRYSNLLVVPDAVAVIELKDPETVTGCLDKLATLGVAHLGKPGALGELDRRAHLSVTRSVYRGVPIRVVQLKGMEMPIAPAFAVMDNKLVLAMTVPSLKSHILHVKQGGAGILGKAGVADQVARLGGGPYVGFSYLDARAGFEYVYGLVPLAYTAAAGATPIPLGLDIEKLPPAAELTRGFFPAVSLTRHDGRAIIETTRTPLPLPGSQASMVAAVPILAGMMLPALSSARAAARRASSMSNMRQLGLGSVMYMDDHNGRLPENLGQLMPYIDAKQGDDISVFHSPVDPRGEAPLDKDKLVEQSSYLLNPKLAGKSVKEIGNPSLAPLMIERPGHYREGTLVLFADGHVEFIQHGPRLREILKQFE